MHYAADNKLSLTRFTPVVSTQMTVVLKLTRREQEQAFVIDVSICDQSQDGKIASIDMMSIIAVVTLKRFYILNGHLGLDTVRSAEYNTVRADYHGHRLEWRAV